MNDSNQLKYQYAFFTIPNRNSIFISITLHRFQRPETIDYLIPHQLDENNSYMKLNFFVNFITLATTNDCT